MFITWKGIFDFNVGYLTTVFLGICFMGLGSFVMFNSNLVFSSQGSIFADQLIQLYTKNFGNDFYFFIAIAALTTMFSTTLTCLDASPRAMTETMKILMPKYSFLNYIFSLFFEFHLDVGLNQTICQDYFQFFCTCYACRAMVIISSTFGTTPEL